ncbi:hypothetical protein E2C01_032804 [Portunus trituberculatus]|uniref:Uncharacterized protein n=1 Tax=Portunus trituberculatus TaxID=210409 RepID=A0A5B7F2E9_PORTR|nr:hypothetical protein [Portunus trituberculatus]
MKAVDSSNENGHLILDELIPPTATSPDKREDLLNYANLPTLAKLFHLANNTRSGLGINYFPPPLASAGLTRLREWEAGEVKEREAMWPLPRQWPGRGKGYGSLPDGGVVGARPADGTSRRATNDDQGLALTTLSINKNYL